MLTTVPVSVLKYDILPYLFPQDLKALAQANKAMHTIVCTSVAMRRANDMGWWVALTGTRLIHNMRNIRYHSPACWRYICLFNQFALVDAHDQAFAARLIPSTIIQDEAIQLWNHVSNHSRRYITDITNGSCSVFEHVIGGTGTLIYCFDLHSTPRKINIPVCDPIFWAVISERPDEKWDPSVNFNVKITYRWPIIPGLTVLLLEPTTSLTQGADNTRRWLTTLDNIAKLR